VVALVVVRSSWYRQIDHHWDELFLYCLVNHLLISLYGPRFSCNINLAAYIGCHILLLAAFLGFKGTCYVGARPLVDAGYISQLYGFDAGDFYVSTNQRHTTGAHRTA
jgi:hypothetical protein